MDDATIINRFEVHHFGVFALCDVQEGRRTLGICDAAIRQDPRNARWVPEVLCTPEQLLKWVECDGWVFGDIEPNLRTVELAIAAVDFDPYILNEEWVWMELGGICVAISCTVLSQQTLNKRCGRSDGFVVAIFF
jgi:hypothetical protein